LPNLPKETRSDYVNDVQTLVFLCFFLAYALKKMHVFNFINTGFLLKRAYQFSSVTQTDTTGFLVINQGELERNKFGLIAYSFILKTKGIIVEPNIMGTKLV